MPIKEHLEVEEENLREYLDPEETKQLEDVASCLRDKLLVRLLRRLGCRITEVLHIEVGQIDFVKRRVTIEHLKFRINLACPKCGTRLAKAHVFCPKCSIKVIKAIIKEKEHRRQRIIPVDRDTLNLVKAYIQEGGPVQRDEKVLLFGFSRQWAWEIIHELAERAGLPRLKNTETGRIHGVSPHKMRDSFAVNAIKKDSSGDGVRILQEMLGHQSINTTFRYRKVAGDELQRQYDEKWK